jgi:FixJ family two-component response regulator
MMTSSLPVSGATLNGRSVGTPVVFVVDDDISVRESLKDLIEQAGWCSEVFASAEAFLARDRQFQTCCLVLDVSLPDLNGLEVQQRLAGRADLPIIFITGHGNIPTSVRAMKAGAVEFLAKPFRPEDLLDAIKDALELSSASLEQETYLQSLRLRYASLTSRERQVMALVVLGLLNKQVGGELGISEITVKAHRGRLMRKMAVRSLAELVYIAARLGHVTAGKRSSDIGAHEHLIGSSGDNRFGGRPSAHQQLMPVIASSDRCRNF